MTRMFSLLLLLLTSAAFLLPAEGVPQTLLYQGLLKDAEVHADGSRDFTVALYAAASGWRKAIGTSSWDLGLGVATDAAGNIYDTGFTYGALDGQASAGLGDIVLIKWNDAGVKQWTRKIGTSASDWGTGVATDVTGSTYVTGYSQGHFAPEPLAGGRDIVQIKFYANGDRP